ncbi:MAG: formate--tetrahydrofolate ligase, partial [Chloroflexi bacterium]|nr:formate--tetrahydrofolate ligase [Chloroflexota bacterium]
LKPNAVVLVATIRALKAHTGKYRIIPGKPIDAGLREENVADVEAGAVNMVRHLENLRKFGVNPVVAINVYTDDSPLEIEAVREIALANGAVGASVAKHWAQGGAGAAELAEMIVSACDSPNDFRLLYPDDMALTDKIETIAREIYRADGVDYAPIASRKLRQYEAQGLRKLPICMAKTHLSLSDDPKLKGAPDGFRISITDVRASAGAGFIYPLCGDVRTMPGLGRMPAAMNVDIDADGKVVGLF